MMNLNDPVFVELIWQQFWQCSLLVLIVFLLCKLIRFRRSHLTFLLWLLVLLKFMTPPLWSFSSGLFCWVQEAITYEEDSPQPSQLPPALTLTESIRSMIGDDMSQLPDVETKSSPYEVTIRHIDPNEKHDRQWDQGALVTQPAGAQFEQPQSVDSLLQIVLYAWALVACSIVGVMSVRYWRCWRIVRSAGEQHHPELNLLLDRLCEELKVKRRVRLRITKSRMGPAVMGLLRPTIILPEVITHARSLRELEPILAHELIHIRRGDLWVGLLQLLASVVWWFHPLVWFTGHRLKFEIEQCCDEEVLAELNCDPGIYAKCLLDILELKQSLKTVPVVPGVRPVEITSKRLERIMKLGQGSHKRTLWWCWMIFVGLLAVILPGAAFVVSADDQQNQPAKFSQKEIINQSEPVREEPQDTASTPLSSELLALLPPKSIPEKFQRNQSSISTFSIQFLFEDYLDEEDIEETRSIWLNALLYQLNGQLETQAVKQGKNKSVATDSVVIDPWTLLNSKDYYMLSRKDEHILMIKNQLLVMSEDPRLSQDVSRILQFLKSMMKFSRAETMKRNQSLATKKNAKEPFKKSVKEPLLMQASAFEEGQRYRFPVPVGPPIGGTTRVGETTSNSPHISSYPIKILIAEAREKVGAQQAEFDFLQKIRLAVSDLRKLAPASQAKSDPKHKANASALSDSQGILILNDYLMVMSDNPAVHQRVALALETITESMATQVLVEAKIISVPRKMIESMSMQTKKIKTNDSFSVRRKHVRKMNFRHNGIVFQENNIDRLIPYDSEIAAQSMIYEVLNDQRVKEIEQVIQASTEVKYLSAPSLTMLNDGAAQITIGRSPVSPAKNAGSDQRHERGEFGISIELRPRFSENASEEKSGRLDYQITFSGRRNLTTQKALDLKTGQEKTVELPLLTKVRYEDSAQIKWGQTLLFGGCSIPDLMSETEVLLVMFKMKKVKPLEEDQVMQLQGVGINSEAGVAGQIVIDESNFSDALVTEIYPVANLVVPIPQKYFIRRKEPGPAPPMMQPRFEPLIELIKLNVTPDEWDNHPEQSGHQRASTIRPFKKTMSLVIRHTRAGHAQIAQLLEKLRAVQDRRIELKLHLIASYDMQAWLKGWEQSELPGTQSLLSQLKTSNLAEGICISSLQADLMQRMSQRQLAKTVNLLRLSTLILFDGQSADVKLFGESPTQEKPENTLQLRSELLNDEILRLSFVINGKDALDTLFQLKSKTVPKGNCLLVDITDQIRGYETPFRLHQLARQTQLNYPEKTKRCLLLITPSVLKESELVERRLTPQPTR